jgi:outer membrane cobalamin receptor
MLTRHSGSVTLAAWYERTREAYAKPEPIALDTEFRERFIGAQLAGSVRNSATEGRLTWESRHRRLVGEDFLRPHLAFGTRERFEHNLRGTVTSRRRFGFGMLAATLSGALNLADDAGPHFTPRADLAWHREHGRWRGQVRVGWGRAFRRPRLTSLFWKADANARGNPDLKPERASEWDIGLNISRGRFDCDTRYFERSLTDVIVWDKRGIPPAYQPVNLDAAYVAGREDHIGYTLDHGTGRLTLAYTHVFTDSHDRTGDRQYHDSMLVFTPRHTHALSLRGSWGRIAVQCDGRWVSRRFTLRAGTKWLDPYRAFDAGCEFTLRCRGPRAVLHVAVENLTNERIELLGRYPSPARTWSLGAALTF